MTMLHQRATSGYTGVVTETDYQGETEMTTRVIHQEVACGVACGVPPYHFKTNPRPDPDDGTKGWDMANTTYNMQVTCPECLKTVSYTPLRAHETLR